MIRPAARRMVRSMQAMNLDKNATNMAANRAEPDC